MNQISFKRKTKKASGWGNIGWNGLVICIPKTIERNLNLQPKEELVITIRKLDFESINIVESEKLLEERLTSLETQIELKKKELQSITGYVYEVENRNNLKTLDLPISRNIYGLRK